MNQPTREEFEQLVARVSRIEQRTEEIKAVRVEVANNRLKTLEQGQQELKEDVAVLKEDVAVLKEDVGVLKIEMQSARADILQIRESQADQRDRLIEYGSHLSAIETKQDVHAEVLGKLVNFAESHDQRFDSIEKTQEDHRELLSEILAQVKKRE